MTPRVTVIIPTYHDWEELKNCLDALSRQTLPSTVFEIIVVNNDPSEPPPSNLCPRSNVTILDEGHPGSYAARNRAVEIAQGEVLAFTDADCLPAQDWLATALDYIDQGALRVAGKVEVVFQPGRLGAAECFEKAYAFRQNDNARNGVSVTANLITIRSVLEQVGQFNDSLMSGGDFEWNLRATNLGLPIVYGESCIVQHPARSSLTELLVKHKRVAGTNPLRHGGTWKTLWMGFLPSPHSFRIAWRNPRMSLREKTLAMAMHYILKVYRTVIHLYIRTGASAPSRR